MLAVPSDGDQEDGAENAYNQYVVYVFEDTKMSRPAVKLSAVLVFFWAILAAGPAFAYLDPGTGSIILQGIIAAVAAASVTARIYWHRILDILGLGKSRNQDRTAGVDKDEQESDTKDSG